MAELSTLARPYAKAVFELARDTLDQSQALIDALGSQIGAEGANLLRLLIDNGRLKLAPAIAAEYEALRAEAEATIDVEITTASPAAPEQLAALVDAIARRLARKLNVTTKVDESLIGGAVIRAGDLVIDGSSVGELERLRLQLVA